MIGRWTWKGRRWPLLVEGSVKYQIYSRKQLFDPQCLKYFLINCQSCIFGRFHIKTRFLPSPEKSEDIIMLGGYFCMAIVFLSMGNVSLLLHKPSFFDRAFALICNTYLLPNSEEFSTPGLVKQQGSKYSVEWIQGI